MRAAALLSRRVLHRGIMTKASEFYADCQGASGFKFFVDNEWRESSSGRTVAIINPSTNAPAYQVQGESNKRSTPGSWPLPLPLPPPVHAVFGSSA